MINKTRATDKLIKTRDMKTADNCDNTYRIRITRGNFSGPCYRR